MKHSGVQAQGAQIYCRPSLPLRIDARTSRKNNWNQTCYNCYISIRYCPSNASGRECYVNAENRTTSLYQHTEQPRYYLPTTVVSAAPRHQPPVLFHERSDEAENSLFEPIEVSVVLQVVIVIQRIGVGGVNKDGIARVLIVLV
jgi:hypothetical protein